MADEGNLQRWILCSLALHVYNSTSRYSDMWTCLVVTGGCRAVLSSENDNMPTCGLVVS